MKWALPCGGVWKPRWDLLTPSSLCSRAKVAVRLSQSSYTEWNIDSNALAWNSAPASRVAGSSPGRLGPAGSQNSGLPQTSLSPCLPWKHLEMLPSTETTQTSLCSGWEKFILVQFNSAEGRTDPPGTLRPAVGWQGEEWNSSSEGVLTSSEFCWVTGRVTGGKARGPGGTRGFRAGIRVRGGGWRSQQGQGMHQMLLPTALTNRYCNSPHQDHGNNSSARVPEGRISVSCNGWSVFPVKAVWGPTLHRSLGVSSYSPLTAGSNKLPATTSEPSCCRKDSRSAFIHCPCCKLNSALLKSLKFVICHEPCHQTSAISAGGAEIKQSEGFG